MLKKIFGSKLVRFSFSIVLIYFAFKKVDVLVLIKQLVGVKIWFFIVNLLLSFLMTFLVSYRWSILLMKKPKISDVWIFAKSAIAASFYGLFFPSSAAGDVLKWIIIDEKYPEIPKTKLLGSVILDRFIGMSMFVTSGVTMLLLARFKGVKVPWMIELVFFGLLALCIIFYIALAFFDLTKIWKIKWLERFKVISELVNKDNVKQIFKGILVSLISEVFWVFQVWFISWYFGAGLSIMSIFIYLPIISMILILPISFAGFGAREQLYLFFFGPLAKSPEAILLISTFSGILGIFGSLIGGLVTLTPDFKESMKSTDLKKVKERKQS